MLSLKKKSAILALSAGLTLGLAACGSSSEGTTTGTAATADASPVAKIDSLTGESTAVKLDPAFLAGLTSLKLTPAVLGGATLVGDVISFPISGGNVTYFTPGSVDPYVQGEIDHDGSGLQLTGGGKVVKLENFVVDPGKSMLTGKVTVDGKVAFESAPLFFLDGRTLQPLAAGTKPNTAVLQVTTVTLTAEAAAALNGVFGVTALAEGFPVGVATITVDTPA